MKIALLGYGKMGKEIEQIAFDNGYSVELKVTSKNADFSLEDLKECDVAIEFSRPEFAVDNILKCFEASVPVVVGTTGWYEKFEEIEKACADLNGALLYGTNFSVGVNIFYEINRKLAALMNSQNQYDVEMTEIHHTQKLDAPSGTAISLAEDILLNLERKKVWINEVEGSSSALSIESQRIENVPGTHIVKYESDIDLIEIRHEAKNRKGFAMGAVLAAEFIIGKKGIYTMKDVLSIG